MQNKQHRPGAQNKEALNLQVITKYLAYWPFFVLFLLLAIGGAYFYLGYAIPKYEANATILIKDEKKGTEDTRAVESFNPISNKKIIENEIEVLQSRSLMNAVVKTLHLYAPIFQEGKIKSISAYQIAPILVEAVNPDSIVKTGKINLEYDAKKGIVLLNKSFSSVINKWTQTPYGVLKFIHNDKYVPSTQNRPYYFFLVEPKDVASQILASLKVSAINKLSSVINLSYRDEIPQRAEDILNELIIAYGNAALNEKNTLAKNTLAFIKERLSVVSKDLDSIEARLQQYKSGRGAVDIGKQGQLYLESVTANDRKLSDLDLQVSALNQLEHYATSPGSSGMPPSSLGVNDASLTQQMNNLSTLQQKYDQLKGTVAENHPALTSIANQISQIKPTILSNIQSQRKNLEKSRSSIYTTSGVYNSMISSIPKKEMQLVEITRDQNIKNGIYSFLLQKREESELTLASSIPDSKIVNYAQSSGSPVSPNKMMTYLMAIAFALACPTLFITVRELFSPKILYRSEIDALTTIPVIGEITFNKTKTALIVKAGKRTIMAEEFRKIRVSLLSLGIDALHKKILITSSISGEGKSFVAANLATSISLTGKKVVLVDLDLHNPGLGKFFGIKEQSGVSDYLVGKNEPAQIIYQIPGNENLFYISSGPLVPDSSELLENGKIQTLIAQLDTDFDVVVIDSAPIVLITDAYLLSNLCDATLYVIRHMLTPKMLIKRIDENMGVNPIKNPAILFNGVKARGYLRSNYGYGYNNYVYGYDTEKKKKSVI
ncbi:MAG: polysaccharide biosynthesis tyrosine autokinase [Ferruginibacter sp.]